MTDYRGKGDEITPASEDNYPNVFTFSPSIGVDYSAFERISGSLGLIASH